MSSRDARTARQAAQRAARALVAGRTSTVGDLAARHAELQAALGGIEAARAQGAELVQAARQQAQQLLDTAEQHADTRRTVVQAAHQAARDAGWTSADLTALGLGPPVAPGPRRAQPTGPATGPAAAPLADGTPRPQLAGPAAQAGPGSGPPCEEGTRHVPGAGTAGPGDTAVARSTVSA